MSARTKYEYCEECLHFKAYEITDGLWGKECEKDLEPEWDDEEECFDCEEWRPCPWPWLDW